MYKKKFNSLKTIRFRRFARKSYSAFGSMHKVITIGVLAGSTLLSAHAASVTPIERTVVETSSDTVAHKELDEVTVAATKVDLPLSMAAKQVTVIGRTEIERAPVKSVQDLLNYVAGVDILQRSPHGVQADISLRGGSADQVAILLNGVNLTNPQTGHYSFDIPINLSDIERIEIVQGPTSLAYGASALSGGINIITKKDTASNLTGKVEVGMHRLFGAEVRGAYKIRSTVSRLSVGYDRSSGYIANSDYDILNALLQTRLEVQRIASVDIQAGYNAKKYGANTFYSPAYPNQYDDTRGMFASVKAETYGRLRFVPQIYWSRHYDCFQLIREGTPNPPAWYKDHNYHRSDVWGVTLNVLYSSPLGITSFGGELRGESILSSVLGKPLDVPRGKYTKADSRRNTSLFVEHNLLLDKFTLSLGGILNHNTAVAGKVAFYPAVNVSYRPTYNLSLYASFDMATRMPSFTELYYTTRTHTGSPNLLPEYTRSAEAGIRFTERFINIRSSVFYTQGKNLIDWQYNQADSKWYSVNLASDSRLATFGIGYTVGIDFEELLGSRQPLGSLSVGYQYIDQNNDKASTNNPISVYVFNFLRHKITATLSHRIVDKLRATWNFRWQDRAGSYTRYVDSKPAETVSYKPFGLLDVRLDYSVGCLSLFVNANNIFNRTYMDFGNIPQPGLWITGGISYRLH